MKNFYVYIYLDPRNDVPFYVGKGFGWRYKRHLTKYATNIHLKNRVLAIRREGFEPIIGRFFTVSEDDAFQLERALILAFGRRDQGTGSLCNYTDGGEGSSGRKGFKHTEETKRHLSQKLKGREVTQEHRDRIGASNKGRGGPSEETKRKAIEAQRRPEYRKKMSDIQKRIFNPLHQKKMTELAAETFRKRREEKQRLAKNVGN